MKYIRQAKMPDRSIFDQNRRAEWLAFRFCSLFFAAYGLWKMLDFCRASVTLTNE
jgi:hypothetical protein